MLHWWLLFRRSIPLFLVAGVTGALIAYLLTLPVTPLFRAHASVEIENLNEDFLNLHSFNATNSSTGATYAEILTQARVLESKSLLNRVVKRLTSAYPADRFVENGRFDLLFSLMRAAKDERTSDEHSLLRAAAKSVSVKAGMSTRIIELSTTSADPKLARDFVNTWTDQFVTDAVESRWTTIQRTEQMLTKQIGDLRTKLEASETSLQDFANVEGFLSGGDNDGESLAEEKLHQLQAELSKAQADRMSREALLEAVTKNEGDALSNVTQDQTLATVRNKLIELRREYAELSSSLTPDHFRVQRVQAQISELEGELHKESTAVLDGLRASYDAALKRQSLLEKSCQELAGQVATQNSRAVHYNILKREVETNRQLYEAMLKQVKEAGLASAMRASGIRILDPAQMPTTPDSPHRILIATFGGLFGLLGSMAFVLLWKQEFRTFLQPGDAQRWVGIAELGAIPHVRAKHLAAGSESADRRSKGHPLDLSLWKGRFSLAVEAFRATVPSLGLQQIGGSTQTLVITSPEVGDGKTMVSCNLAIAAAEANRRVLLIDADLRRPHVNEFFRLSNGYGLTDLLALPESPRDLPLNRLCSGTPFPGLYVLPAGMCSQVSGQQLYSERLEQLLMRFREEFDVIILDTPPMLVVADPRIVSRLADGVVLVFAAGKTTEYSAAVAKETLRQDGTKLIGAILNRFEHLSKSHYYATAAEQAIPETAGVC